MPHKSNTPHHTVFAPLLGPDEALPLGVGRCGAAASASSGLTAGCCIGRSPLGVAYCALNCGACPCCRSCTVSNAFPAFRSASALFLAGIATSTAYAAADATAAAQGTGPVRSANTGSTAEAQSDRPASGVRAPRSGGSQACNLGVWLRGTGSPVRNASSDSPPRDLAAAPLCLSISSMSFCGMAPLKLCG